MRLFIAIPIDSEVKKYLGELPVLGRHVADYHITLKFLGDLSEINPLIQSLDNVKAKSFRLTLSKIGFFPSKSKQRIVWAGVTPIEPVIELHKKIEKALNLVKEKQFHPHITLSRLRNQSMQSINLKKKEINVRSFNLIKSTLTQNGPVYQVIKDYLLS